TLASGIAAIGRGLDALASNMDTVAKVSKIVGATLLTAFGPAILGAVKSLTVAIAYGLVGAIRAVGVAIKTNPIGFLVTAIVAVITAAYQFRDELSRILGVDVTALFK